MCLEVILAIESGPDFGLIDKILSDEDSFKNPTDGFANKLKESIFNMEGGNEDSPCYLLLSILYKYVRRIEVSFVLKCCEEPIKWNTIFMLVGLRTLYKLSTMKENDEDDDKLRDFFKSWITYHDSDQLLYPSTLPFHMEARKDDVKIELQYVFTKLNFVFLCFKY